MSLDKMPASYKKTFSRYITLFGYIGIDFFDDSTSYLTWNNGKVLLFIMTFMPFCLGQFGLIAKIRVDNFLETVRVVPFDIMILLDVVKLTIVLWKRCQMRDIFVEIGELWPRSVDRERHTILVNYLRRKRKPVDLFLLWGYANCVYVELVPLIISLYNMYNGDEIYVFPFQPTFLLAYDTRIKFYVNYLMELISSTPCQICVYLPFDLTLVTLTFNVSVLLLLLQRDLKNAINLANEDATSHNNVHRYDPETYETVKKIVQIHQRLLSLAAQLNDIFGLVIFIHVALASLEICFFGFLTVVYSGLVNKMLHLMTVLSAVFTFFLLSFAGQTLCDMSSGVADAAYEILWYESDENVRKLMLFIMIRAQRPSYLSALGFSDLTLRSFSKVMSSSYTYFSLIIQLYGDTSI